MFRKDFVAIALLLSAAQVSADPLIATQYGDFDRYVLALSWQKSRFPHRSRPVAEPAKIHCRARSGRAALDAFWLRDPPCSQHA